MGGNVTPMDKRVSKLEGESAETRAKLDQMHETQIEISKSMSSLATSQGQIANTLEKVNETMERFKAFEVRAEENRKSEREHRDRLDRRVDDLQKDMTNARRDADEDLNRIYSTIRKDKEQLNDKIDSVDKEHNKKYNELNTKLEVKTGVDEVKQSSTQKILDVRGDRIWKLLFWFVTAVGAIVLLNGLKGG